jgi:hypothetical protein
MNFIYIIFKFVFPANADVFLWVNNQSVKNVIEKPTRVTNHSRTLLDHIIVSDTINYVNSDDVFKLPDNISDHDASVVTI